MVRRVGFSFLVLFFRLWVVGMVKYTMTVSLWGIYVARSASPPGMFIRYFYFVGGSFCLGEPFLIGLDEGERLYFIFLCMTR